MVDNQVGQVMLGEECKTVGWECLEREKNAEEFIEKR